MTGLVRPASSGGIRSENEDVSGGGKLIHMHLGRVNSTLPNGSSVRGSAFPLELIRREVTEDPSTRIEILAQPSENDMAKATANSELLADSIEAIIASELTSEEDKAYWRLRLSYMRALSRAQSYTIS